MKIHDIQSYIHTFFPNLPLTSIHHTKKSSQGDFVIHIVTQQLPIIPKIPYVEIMQHPKMVTLTVDKSYFGPLILESILFTPNYGHKTANNPNYNQSNINTLNNNSGQLLERVSSNSTGELLDKVTHRLVDNNKNLSTDITNPFYIIEYSSPNIAKKFHPGHLRTTILGNYIKNICESMGITTHSINYLGDWGKQFGLVGTGFIKFGNEDAMLIDPLKHLYNVYVKASSMDLDDEAKDWFRDLENGKPENVKLWQRFRQLSIDKYMELYSVLNVRFDEYSGESMYGKMGRDIITKLECGESLMSNESIERNGNLKHHQNNVNCECGNQNKNIGYSGNDATNFDKVSDGIENIRIDQKSRDIPEINNNTQFETLDIQPKNLKIKPEEFNTNPEEFNTKPEEYNTKPEVRRSIVQKDVGEDSRYIETSCGKVCVMKRDGSTLYVTRDIAAVVDRVTRFNPDKIIYVVASQQDLYLKQLFEIAHMAGIGYKNGKNILEHINYGMIEGMSTRKGNVEFLEDILDEARNVMHEKMMKNKEKFEMIEDIEKTAEILAVTALIIHDFDAKRIKGYKFNMDQCTEINGFTGPYLQYVHCRLKSIEDRNKDLIDLEKLTEKEFKQIYEGETDAKIDDIIYKLSKYPLILEKSFEGFEPSLIVNYLMDLCKSINGIISQFKVLNMEKSVAIKRLLFYRGTRMVLGNGLKILGIIPLNRM